jgi:hypothetical protein
MFRHSEFAKGIIASEASAQFHRCEKGMIDVELRIVHVAEMYQKVGP